ncbi:MAG: hypothetical protein PHN78_08960 [Dehalococcoidales bacterium]|nr:hypothetical protein [Dehalococcoidales bacterium]
MHTVTFVIALIFFLIAAIISGFAMVRISGDKANARSTLTAGFSFWLVGIVLASLLFGFFSL